MTYTRSQLHERISDLSGSYKAALENKRLTSEKRAEQDRLSDLARQADEKADGHLLEIAAQINEAKAQYAAAVDELIAPGVPPEAHVISQAEMDANCLHHGRSISSGPNGGHVCDECGGEYVLQFNSIFTEGADFQAQMLANGEAKLNQAFDEATGR